MLYAPVSKTGLVTIPKAARDFLGIQPGTDAIKVEMAPYHCLILSKFDVSEKSLLVKPVRVTKKGQLSISGKLRSHLQLEAETEVSFSVSNDQLILTKAGKEKPCLACSMTGYIHGHECCICKGTGKTRSHPSGILSEIFISLQDSRKYNIGYSIINQEKLPDNSVVFTDMPRFHVWSSTLPDEYVSVIQQHFERQISEEYTKLTGVT